MAFMLAKAIKTTKPRPSRGEAATGNGQQATGSRLHATGRGSNRQQQQKSVACCLLQVLQIKLDFTQLYDWSAQEAAPPMGMGSSVLNVLDGLHPAPIGIRSIRSIRVWAAGRGSSLGIALQISAGSGQVFGQINGQI